MKYQIKTRCFTFLCFCNCPQKKHSKLSRRGIKFIPSVISKALFQTGTVSRTESERSSSDERFVRHHIKKPEPIHQIADDEEKHYTLSEHGGEAYEISHGNYNGKILRIGDSETTAIPAIAGIPSSSSDSEIIIERSYKDGIPTSTDSEISYESSRDERPKHREPKTGGETKYQKSCRHVILNSRDSEISYRSHTDERSTNGEYKLGHKIRKIVVAPDIMAKQKMIIEHNGEASEVSLHEGDGVEIPRRRDSETSSQKSYSDEVPTSRDSETSSQRSIPTSRDTETSHKSYRYEKPGGRESKTRHKISKDVIADDKKVEQYRISEHHGGLSEISLHESYGVEIPRKTGSEKSCRDGILNKRDSEICQKSYREEKPRHTQSIGSHKISNVVVANAEEVKQYTRSEHDGEASEISLQQSHSVGIARNRDPEIRSEKSYGDDRQGHTVSKTRHKRGEIVVANDQDVKQYTMSEHDGEASKIILHESYNNEIPRRRDSEISSQNSCRDGIPTSKDFVINHKSYRDQKQRQAESKTSYEISKTAVADDEEAKQSTIGEYDGKASEISLPECYSLELPRSIDFETSNQKTCRDEIPMIRDTDISNKSNRDKKEGNREHKTGHKISKNVVADDNEIRQYTRSEHEGSNIILQKRCSLEIPRRRDSETESQSRCRDAIPISRVSKINYNIYRDGKPKQTDSKTSHKISEIAYDNEIEQSIMSEQDREASQTSLHESCSTEMPRSRGSETTSQISCDGIPTGRVSEITHKNYRDEKLRDTKSKTGHKINKTAVADDKLLKHSTLGEHDEEASEISLHDSYSVDIPISLDSESSSSQNSYGEGKPTSRDSEIGHKCYRDEKSRHRQSKTSDEISNFFAADDEEIKQYTGTEHNGDATGINVHKNYSVEIPRSIDSGTSGQEIYSDGLPTGIDYEISHKNYRDEKSRNRKSKTSHKISQIRVADGKETKQYPVSEHDEDASEISLHGSYSVELPRSTDSDASDWKSCRNETATSRDSDIRHKSHRDEKTRCRASKTRQYISNFFDVNHKVGKRYITSEHDREASEISLHGSYGVEIPRSGDSETSTQSSCRYGILTSRDSEISHKSYRAEKLRDKESKTRHKISKILVADDKEVKSEHDGEASEISVHEIFVPTPSRSRDSDTSSQKSVSDGIPTSKDSDVIHKNYRDEKPTHRESQTSTKSYRIEIPKPIQDRETSRQKSLCRGKPIHKIFVNWWKNRGRDELSIHRSAEISQTKCKNQTQINSEISQRKCEDQTLQIDSEISQRKCEDQPLQIDSEISQKKCEDQTLQNNSEISQSSYRHIKCFEIREQCRDETISTFDDSPFTSDKFGDPRDKSGIVEPFYENENYDETIRQLVRQFFAEEGLHAAEILKIDDGGSISQISYPESVHKLVRKDDEGTHCHYCTATKVHGQGCDTELEARGFLEHSEKYIEINEKVRAM